MVEHEGCRPGEEVGNYIRQRNEAPIRPDGVVRTRLSSAEGEVVLFVREPGVPAEELLEMAADLVHSWTCSYGGILGEPLTAHELRALALPDWHINVSSSPRDVDEASEPGRTPKSWRAYFAEGHGWHEKNRRLMAEGAKMCEGDESSLEHAYQDLEEAMKRVCGDVPQSSLAFDEEDAEERPKREERGDSSASSSLEVPNRA
ncbi:hypothetical protein GQ53DRAFT_744577 [Thozetella sp. PMI_491]|nr:hypothetical protein GQ53DRAFT_744577 [Thozetella sp. PMI_491]